MASVPGVIARTVDLDLDIFRTMYRTGGVSLAGIDPRLNPSRVSERLGVSRARVAARLREWTQAGLLERYDVWPNPALFDREGFTVDVRATDRLGKPELFRRAALIEGALGGFEAVGEWLTLQFLVPSAADAARISALLTGLSGIAEVGERYPWRRLEPARPLTPLDRRIVRVLRAHPSDPLSAIARHVGVSTRTITTRYGQLVEDLAVWFVPVLDFRALAAPLVSLNVQCAGAEARREFGRALRRAYPQSLELVSPGFGPVYSDALGVYFVLCPSAARVEDLERFVRGHRGVLGCELLTLIRTVSFPETFDRLLAEPDRARPEKREKPARPARP